MMFVLFLNGCEKSADQTPSVNVAHNGQLINRDTDPCDACTLLNDCCCGIELQNPNGAGSYPIRICGNDDGTMDCSASPPSPCGTVRGGLIPFTLSSAHPKVPFCMVPGGYVKISNPGTANAVIKITCHYDIVNPTYTFVTVTPGHYYAYHVDTGCDLTECYHD